ncbi:uncharacterized protein JCM15063_002599 [Sporobolomyces koalae]|uniref:uncharacterized protein n=1 Tax=Sporobolomyces koalae TaxID=500713 RepID=UPI00317C91F7
MDTKEALQAHIDKALAIRLEGNTKFKRGDLKGALRDYHTVIMSLKGLEGKMQQLWGMRYKGDSMLPTAQVNKIEEIKEGDDTADSEQHATQGGSEGSSDGTSEGQAEESDPPFETVRTALLNTHINSAAIHIKLERWQRALECAQYAKKLDEKNPKAAFREAQARIGLGQISMGKSMLLEMQKTHPDAAIDQALAKLDVDEQERESRKNSQFRGMFAKAKSTDNSPARPQQPASGDTAQAGNSSKSDSAEVPALAEKSQQVSQEGSKVAERVKEEVNQKDTHLTELAANPASKNGSESNTGSPRAVQDKSDAVSSTMSEIAQQVKKDVEKQPDNLDRSVKDASEAVSQEGSKIAKQVKADVATQDECKT